jgi:hypothetical protein
MAQISKSAITMIECSTSVDSNKNIFLTESLKGIRKGSTLMFNIERNADKVSNFYFYAKDASERCPSESVCMACAIHGNCGANSLASNVKSYSLIIGGQTQETFIPSDLKNFVEITNEHLIPLEFTCQSFELIALSCLYQLHGTNAIVISVDVEESFDLQLIYRKTFYADPKERQRVAQSEVIERIPSTHYLNSNEFADCGLEITDLTIHGDFDYLVIENPEIRFHYKYDKSMSDVNKLISDKSTTGIYIPLNISIPRMKSLVIKYYNNDRTQYMMNPRIRLSSQKTIHYSGGLLQII